MTNEEILKAAQHNKEDIGEYEKTVVRKSLMYGAAVGVAICVVMCLVECLIVKKFDFGKPSLIFAITGFADLYEGLKNKIVKKKIIGIIELVAAMIFILLYIGALFV